MRLLSASLMALGAMTCAMLPSSAISAEQVKSTSRAAPAAKGKQLYYFMVFSNAQPGAEEEFKRWYDDIHAPVMIESSDFVWSQRFEISPVQFGGGINPQFPKRQYVVIFAVETDNIEKVVADAEQRMHMPRNISSKSLDYRSLIGVTYMASGPKVTQKQARAMLDKETAAGRLPGRDVQGPPDVPADLPPPLAK